MDFKAELSKWGYNKGNAIDVEILIDEILPSLFFQKEEPQRGITITHVGKQEKICTGCGTLSSEELGKNRLGENFLACCPDSDYVNVQEYQEYGLLQHIKFCLKCGNEAQAIRLIEKYGFEKQEQEKNKYSEEEVINILNEYGYAIINEDKINSIGTIKKWFEQFKNK